MGWTGLGLARLQERASPEAGARASGHAGWTSGRVGKTGRKWAHMPAGGKAGRREGGKAGQQQAQASRANRRAGWRAGGKAGGQAGRQAGTRADGLQTSWAAGPMTL